MEQNSYTRLGEVTLVNEQSDTTNLIVENNGEIQRLPLYNISISSGSSSETAKTEPLYLDFEGHVYDFENDVSSEYVTKEQLLNQIKNGGQIYVNSYNMGSTSYHVNIPTYIEIFKTSSRIVITYMTSDGNNKYINIGV